MKQNSNKNITKITSGALVLLLASGGLFSNSSAKDIESTNVEKVIVDKKLDLEEKDKIKEKESIQESEKNEEVENTDKNIEEVLNNKNEEKSEENSTIQTLVDNIEDDQTNTVESEKETLEENLNEVKNPEVSENNIEKSQNENKKTENVEDVKEETEETDEDKLIVDEKDNIQEENIDNVKENLPENPINDKKDEELIKEKTEENKVEDNKKETSEKELIKEEKPVIEQKEEKNSNEALQVAPVIKKVAVKSPALKAAPKAVSYQNKSSNNGKYINNYNNRQEFLAMLASHSNLAKEYNIFPEVMMGQAILESGWGESTLAKYSKNLFGVKVPNSEKGKGKGHVYQTNEEINGKNIRIKDEFRKFDTYEQSIRQYLSLLSGRYYSSFGVTKAKDYKEQLRLIKKAGYATASNYVDAVLNVITSNNLSALANQYLNSNTTRVNNSATAKSNNPKKNSNTLVSNTSNKKVSTSKTDKNAKVNNKQSQRVAKATQKPSVKVADAKSTTNPQNILASSTKAKKLSSDSKNIIVASTTNAVKNPVENIQANNNVENNENQKSGSINNRKKAQTTDNNVSATTNTTYSNSSSENVKTGIGSLSSILTTLSTASFALIASKKRK
ncbi:glucosaminidase domain-containing protein [Anaerococcus vaginalis]|uniref:glycoside hydrolase family 73 protein n=1 Tax=Anaerococcus vaginalis TaxID=33037 RepID=UPI002908B821|nr:glucosaminidase domain-containing protein [Anaerococcus vaginalis]MDU5559317.1 glucosaminidase domain-containing protein [Anaerococcus vaginalis]